MKRGIKTTVILILIIVLISGCAAKKGVIVRHDISEDELDIFYEGITPQKIEQALGLPHLSRDNGKEKLYYYNFGEGYLEVYFRFGSKYVGNKVIIFGETFQPHAYIDPSKDNRGEIDRNKYLMDIRNDIEAHELDFISEETTSMQLQKVLGAPHDFVLYRQGEGTADEIVTNAYLYELANGDVLKITYVDTGIIFRGWIEDSDGEEKEVLVGDVDNP